MFPTRLIVDDNGELQGAMRGLQTLEIIQWQEKGEISSLSKDAVVMANADISMRNALEIRYQTGLPLLLTDNEKVVGVLSDNDFYHALLGKHFSHAA